MMERPAIGYDEPEGWDDTPGPYVEPTTPRTGVQKMPETGVAKTVRLARDARALDTDEATTTARANVAELGRFMLGERFELTPRGRAELRAYRRTKEAPAAEPYGVAVPPAAL